MAAKSRVLVVGSTGYIGKFIVEASAKAGHPTFALVRDSSLSDPAKSQIIQSFKSIGVTIVTVISQSFSPISLSLNFYCFSVRLLFFPVFPVNFIKLVSLFEVFFVSISCFIWIISVARSTVVKEIDKCYWDWIGCRGICLSMRVW